MNYTQNYHLGLPIPAERYDVSIVNANNTVIDGQLKVNADAITNHKNDHNNPHAVTAAQVGLGNVNNTADANKPVSTAQAQYVTQAVSAESTRAQGVENTLSGQISAEVTRATGAESTLADNLSAETTRATGIENDLAVMISTETTRAQGAESDLRDYVDEKLSVTYKASGSVFFADLPALAVSREGHVYNIKDDFTTTADFVEGAGKDYPAGTNVVIIEKDEESYEAATVEEGDNPSEMGLYELDGSDYVLTTDTSSVEGKTYYELTTTPSYFYDVLAGFIDTSDFVTDTDYATGQTAGIVKPDGTTITVDANGVISAQSGGDVSSEEMADVVNILGAKNYINSLNVDNNIDHATVKSFSDGVLHVYGAIDQEATIWDNSILISSTTMPDGGYILSDGINNSQSKISIFAVIEGTVVAMTHSTQYQNTFHVQGNDEVGFYVYGGQGFDDDIYVYPMCRPKHIENETYAPYAKTNRQLTEDVETLQQTTFSDMTGATSSTDGEHGLVPAPLIADREKFLKGDGTWSGEIGDEISDIVNVLGAKNLLPNNATTQIINGVTFTVNDDGSVRLTGTATAVARFDLPVDLTDGVTYTASGISGGSGATYQVYLQNASALATNVGTLIDGERTFTKNSGQASPNNYDVHIYRINVTQGATVDTVIYPMIRLASITDDTYVPYAMTNRELMGLNNIINVTPTKTSIVNSFGFRKSGHIVSFYFNATPTAASFVDVFTNAPKLATGEMYFYGISSGGGTLKTWCAVYSSGLIRLYVNASETNLTMIFSGTYITSE